MVVCVRFISWPLARKRSPTWMETWPGGPLASPRVQLKQSPNEKQSRQKKRGLPFLIERKRSQWSVELWLIRALGAGADVVSRTLEARWKFPRGGPETKGNRLDYEEGKENELA